MVIKCFKEILLLTLLRQNSRKRLTEISRSTGFPVSTVYERIKSFNNQYIKKYTCILDYEKLGYSARVNMLLKVGNGEKNDVISYLKRRQNINTVSKVNNGYDFFIEGIFRNLVELEKFCEELDERFKIKTRQNFYVVEELKSEGFMSDPEILLKPGEAE